MRTIVVGENIEKAFGEGHDRRSVLDRVSLEINEGEFVSIMGPSGSGKSTLLFALSGMDRIDSGKVTVDGRDISSLPEDELADLRRLKMGFIFQQPTMLKNLNILDNIILPSMRDKKKDVDKITEKARALMQRMGISQLEKRNITQVSGGQLQRAGICRALMPNPAIVFGDEPTGALNSKTAQEMMNTLVEINADGTAIMLVTHDVKVAAQTERIMFMCDGRFVKEMRLPKDKGTDIESRIEKVTNNMREIGI